MSDTNKKSAPLAVRLTQAERDALLIRAGAQTLSAFVKEVLFDGSQPLPRGNGVAVADRTLLAHLLATLGGSRIAPNLTGSHMMPNWASSSKTTRPPRG